MRARRTQRFGEVALAAGVVLLLLVALPPPADHRATSAPKGAGVTARLDATLVAPAAPHPSSGTPYVAETIELGNQSVQPGNVLPGNGRYPYVDAYDPVHRVIYVANDGTDFVTVVDGVNHTVVGYIPIGTQGAFGLCVAGGYLYVAGHDNFLVQVFNTSTRQLVANVPLGTGPLVFAYDPRHERVYVTEQTRPYTLTVISNTNFTVVAELAIRQSPGAIVYDPLDDEIFVGDGGDNINVINGTTLAFVTNLTMGFDPWAGVWDPLNDRVFLAGQQSDNVTVVDPVANLVVGTIWVGGEPNATALDATGQWLYVAVGERSNVTKVNATNITEHYSIPIGAGPAGVAYDIATGEGVTANYPTNNLTFFNGTTGAIDVVVANGYTPTGLAYDPASDEVYIAESSAGNVLVWNESRAAITASISLPGAPSQTLYDPTTGGIYVLRSQLGRVTEIDPTTHAVVRSWNVTAPSPSFAIDAAADRLYVADYNNLRIDLYRLSDGAPLGNLSALSPSVVQYCPGTGRVYAIAGFSGNQVLAIDPTSDTIVANGTIGVLGSAIACDPFNGNVYVANQRTQNVSVLNGTTLAGVASLANGNYGAGVAYDSLNAEIVAAATADDNVTVDGTVNRSLTAIVAVGVGPGSVAFGAAHDTFYVANVDSGTVSLLHPNTAPPRIASLSVRPLVLYEPTNTTFNVSASATSDYGIPCPPGVAYAWTVLPSALATPSGINASTEQFTTTGHLGVGVVVLNASFGGAAVTASVPLQIYGPPPVPLASAAIAPGSASLLVGGTQAFGASALLVGGAPAPATSIFTWTLAPPSIGALNTTSGTNVLFTAAGTGAGTLSLSVYYAGSYAFATSAISVRTAAPEVVDRLTLAPLAPTVSAGGNITFFAVAYDVAGRNVSALASYHWQLHAPSEGTLAIAPGYRQTYEAGNASGVDVLTVTASLGGASVSQNTSITVVGSIGPCCSGGTTGGSSPFDALLHVPWWAWGIGGAIIVGALIALYRWRRPPAIEAELVDAPSFQNAYLALDEPAEEAPSAP